MSFTKIHQIIKGVIGIFNNRLNVPLFFDII